METESFTARGIDPLFRLVLIRKEQCDPERAEPVFGDHCDDMWGGEGCPFAGTECPAAQFVPDVVSHHPVALSSALEAKLLSSPPAEQPGLAFLAVHRGLGPVLPNTPGINSLLHEGVRQLRAGATKVNKQLVERARESGPYSVGDNTYGWRVVETLDVETALRFMVHNMSITDIAKRVSLSPSEVRKISNKIYPGLADKILLHCVREGEHEEFGRMRED